MNKRTNIINGCIDVGAIVVSALIPMLYHRFTWLSFWSLVLTTLNGIKSWRSTSNAEYKATVAGEGSNA